MAKLVVDEDKCIGCGACTTEAEELFELVETDSGYKAKVKKQPESDSEKEKAKSAVDICPVDAISFE